MKSPEEKLFPYLLSYTIPLVIIVGIGLGDFWTFLPVAVTFGIIPLLERYSKTDTSNPNKYEELQWKGHSGFTYILYGHGILQFLIIFTFFIYLFEYDPSTLEITGATLSVGIMMGVVGNNVAHELLHHSEAKDQVFAKILLTTSNALHFSIDHIRGHHITVGTDADTSTARIGESYYHFAFRNIFGSYANGWKLEAQRMKKNGLEVVSLQNTMVVFLFVSIFYNFLLLLILDVEYYFYYLLSTIVALFLLAASNYVNHYGLFRRELEDKTIEPVGAQHSWNSDFKLSRWLLFELTRHSDHHLNPERPYKILRHIESAPQHPAGFAAMILKAFIPPVWFNVMNGRALAIVRIKTDEIISITPPAPKKSNDFLD